MATIVRGGSNSTIMKLYKALGLEGQNASRFVLVCDCKEPVRLYITRMVTAQEIENLAAVIEGVKVVECESVEVDEFHQIQYTPIQKG